MMLRNVNSNAIESAQAHAVEHAGGSRLDGEFEYTTSGWMVTVKGLSFSELVQVLEAARHITGGYYDREDL